MPLLQRTGGMGAKGFGLTSVNTFSFIATISSNTTSYNLATAATAAGWNGVAPLIANVTINNGVVVSGTGNGTSSAFVINGLSEKSIITINNNGTVVGVNGTHGYGTNNGGYDYTWSDGSPPATLNSSTSSFVYMVGSVPYGNYSNTQYYLGNGFGGSLPNYDYYSGGTSGNAGAGSAGGTALYLASNVSVIINNGATGLFVGGGGGSGGQAGNNSSGGVGGAGGYLIEETGSHPAVIANNTSGGILASGGGGAGGWGNRYEGEGHGGYYGASAVQFNWTGAGATAGISSGLATNNTGTTIVNTAGTSTLSPAA